VEASTDRKVLQRSDAHPAPRALATLSLRICGEPAVLRWLPSPLWGPVASGQHEAAQRGRERIALCCPEATGPFSGHANRALADIAGGGSCCALDELPHPRHRSSHHHTPHLGAQSRPARLCWGCSRCASTTLLGAWRALDWGRPPVLCQVLLPSLNHTLLRF